jgi:hypothetical protein
MEIRLGAVSLKISELFSLYKVYQKGAPKPQVKRLPSYNKVYNMCVFLQEERVLFHYTGHGVPKPTTNGEIWVFNKVSKISCLYHTFNRNQFHRELK